MSAPATRPVTDEYVLELTHRMLGRGAPVALDFTGFDAPGYQTATGILKRTPAPADYRILAETLARFPRQMRELGADPAELRHYADALKQASRFAITAAPARGAYLVSFKYDVEVIYSAKKVGGRYNSNERAYAFTPAQLDAFRDEVRRRFGEELPDAPPLPGRAAPAAPVDRVRVERAEAGHYLVRFDRDPQIIAAVKALKERRWDPELVAWAVPFRLGHDLLAALRPFQPGLAFELPEGGPKPDVEVVAEGDRLRVLTKGYNAEWVAAIKATPGRQYDPETRTWTVPADQAQKLKRNFAKVGVDVLPGVELPDEADPNAPVLDLAAELARLEAYPFLLEHQREGAAFLLNRGSAILADDMGLGKASPLYATVYTPAGPVTMGDLKVGDLVVGSDGRPTRVTGVYPQGVQPVYRCTFSDGSSTDVVGEHLWAVNTPVRKKRGNPNRVLTTLEIASSLKDAAGNRRHYVPMVEPVRFERRALPVDPYALGVFLGDGGLTQTTISLCTDGEIADALRLPGEASLVDDGPSFVGGRTRTMRVRGGEALRAALRDLGLQGLGSADKFVPEDYLYSDVEDRLALLQGLLDTDGYAGSVVEFTSASPRLAQAVVLLAQSLGGTARLHLKPAPEFVHNGERRVGLPSWRVTLKVPPQLDPFRLSRKLEAYEKIRPTKYPPTRAFERVEYLGDFEAQCIRVDADDHLYVTDEFIVTHNTLTSAVTAHELSGHGGAILVICPATLKPNWARELSFWLKDAAGDVLIVEGTKEQRVVRYSGDPRMDYCVQTVSRSRKGLDFTVPHRVLVVNYDVLEKLHAQLAAWVDERQPKVCLIDEAHYLKNTKSQRTGAVLGRTVTVDDGKGGTKRQRRKGIVKGRIPNVIPMTGTPVTARPMDLFPLLGLVGHPLGESWHEFGQRFCDPKPAWGGGWDYSGASNLDELAAEIRVKFLQRKKTDPKVALGLPAKTRNRHYVSVDMKAYWAAWDQFLVDFEAAKGRPLDPRHEALVQLSVLRHQAAKQKIPHALEMAREILGAGDKVILFSNYLEVIDTVAAEFGDAAVVIKGGVDKDAAKIAFQNDPSKRVAVCQYVAGGVGLTLTASPHVIMCDLDWLPHTHSQAEDRSFRIGQKRNVQIHYLIAEETHEETVMAILDEKIAVVEKIEGGAALTGDDVREIIARIKAETEARRQRAARKEAT